ncbi:MAG: hypothetical protein AABX38_03925 [Candidatus Micrarchaeota archaeon]
MARPVYAKPKQKWIELNQESLGRRFREIGVQLREPIIEQLIRIVISTAGSNDSPNPHNTMRALDKMFERLKIAGIKEGDKVEKLLGRIDVAPELLYETIRRETKDYGEHK